MVLASALLVAAVLAVWLLVASRPAAAAAATAASGICDRTEQVRDAILEELPNVDDCALVTATDLSAIVRLDLQHKGIQALQSHDFAGLNNVETLLLNGNNLRTLPQGVFDELSSIYYLSLSVNALESLRVDLFAENTTVAYLKLNDNRIRTLPSGIFDGLDDLENVSLRNTQLRELPSDVFSGLDGLRTVQLDHNELREIPSGLFDDLPMLQTIYLDHNEIEALPSGILDDLGQLNHLGISYNRLTSLPEGLFDHNPMLYTFMAYGNLISDIPGDLFLNTPRLSNLYLSDNNISSLPDNMFTGMGLDRLVKRREVYLAGNPGAPFRLSAELVDVGDGAFKVMIREGVPYDTEFTLSVEGGTIPQRRLTMDDGTYESSEVSLTLDPGADYATVRLDSARFAHKSSRALTQEEIDELYESAEMFGIELSGDFEGVTIGDTSAQMNTHSGLDLVLGERLPLGSVGNNSVVVGRPSISGRAQSGSQLTASTSNIEDADGLTTATYGYQWLSDDGTAITEIAGETSATYTITDAQVGKSVRVRVSFTDDGGNHESVSSIGTGIVLGADVPSAPQGLRASSSGVMAIGVGWDAPDSDGGSPITGYKVQWKLDGLEFGPHPEDSEILGGALTGGELVVGEAVIANPSTRHHTITVQNSSRYDPYEIRVIAVNANGDGVPSEVLRASALSLTEQLHQRIDSLVSLYGADAPWIGEAWDKLQSDDVPVIGSSRIQGGRFYRSCGEDAAKFDSGLTGCEATKIEVSLIGLGRIATIIHELAHAYTLANEMSDDPGPLAVAHLYFDSLGLHDLDAVCRPTELYADVVTIMTLGDISTSYWDGCGGDTQEAKTVVGAALGGDMPQWLHDRYGDANGDLDLEQLWSDVKELPYHDRVAVAYQLRGEFGGYCDNWAVTLSLLGIDDTRNPWSDGGCVPSAPAGLRVAELGGALQLAWDAPAGDGGSPVLGYRLYWRSGAEDFDTSSSSTRRATVSGLGHTIAGLQGGVEHEVKVVAYNANGEGAAATVAATPTSLSAGSISLDYASALPWGVWSDGTTMWVTNSAASDARLYAFDLATGARVPASDIDALEDAGNDHARGLWSDGATIWVADGSDNKLYAYDLATGGRVPASDIDTDSGNTHPGGLWSDGATIWVSDSHRSHEHVYAYDLATGERREHLELDDAALTAGGAVNPSGLWSDGVTMWVVDSRAGKVLAFELGTGARRAGLEFDLGTGWYSGLWSDGTDMWAVNTTLNEVQSFAMPGITALKSLVLEGIDIGFSMATSDYVIGVPTTTAATTVSAAAASAGSTVSVAPQDADTSTAGHQVDLSPGDNTIEVTVTNGGDTRTYSVTVTRTSFASVSDDATLSAVTLTGIDIGAFDPDRTHYEIGVASDITTTTVTAVASDENAAVSVSPGDSDSVAGGHQFDVAEGANSFTVVVESSDRTAERTYTFAVNRASDAVFGWNAAKDIYPTDTPDELTPQGIWSDGTTMWVVDSDHWDYLDDQLPKILAFGLADGSRRSSRDITTLDRWSMPRGIWSDETILWVSDFRSADLVAHDLATGARRADRDITDPDVVERAEVGLWSDGETIWMVGRGAEVFAFGLADGSRRSDLDVDILAAHGMTSVPPGVYSDANSADYGNLFPTGLWSDGATVWVADYIDEKIYAYSLLGGSRHTDLEFNDLAPGNDTPAGLWSDGETMWVADTYAGKVFAYNMPDTAVLASLELSGIDLGFHPGRVDYAVTVPDSTEATTVTAEASRDGAGIEISPPDADTATGGHQVDLAVGGTEIAVTVTMGAQTRTYTVTVTRQAPNTPASGAPVVAGTAAVGEILTVDISGVDDVDGIAGAVFTYQWVRDVGGTDADIVDADGASYTLVDADAGNRVKVRVGFTDDAGHDEELTSEPVAVLAGVPERPSRPVAASVSHDAVTITWDDPGDSTITGYQVLRRDRAVDAQGVFHAIADAVAGFSFTDDSVAASGSYVYRIKAQNAQGLSPRSKYLRVDVPAAPPSGPVVDLSLEAISGGVVLRWSPPAGVEGVTRYEIWRDHRLGGGGVMSFYIAVNPSRRVYTDSLASVVGRTYSYEVKALSDGQVVASSGVLQVVFDPPAVDPAQQQALAPSNLVAEAVDGGIRLSWDAPVTDAQSVTSYRLERVRVDGKKPQTRYLGYGSTATTQTDTTPDPGGTYTYRVRASRDGVPSAWSEPVTITWNPTPPDDTPTE